MIIALGVCVELCMNTERKREKSSDPGGPRCPVNPSSKSPKLNSNCTAQRKSKLHEYRPHNQPQEPPKELSKGIINTQWVHEDRTEKSRRSKTNPAPDGNDKHDICYCLVAWIALAYGSTTRYPMYLHELLQAPYSNNELTGTRESSGTL